MGRMHILASASALTFSDDHDQQVDFVSDFGMALICSNCIDLDFGNTSIDLLFNLLDANHNQGCQLSLIDIETSETHSFWSFLTLKPDICMHFY